MSTLWFTVVNIGKKNFGKHIYNSCMLVDHPKMGGRFLN